MSAAFGITLAFIMAVFLGYVVRIIVSELR